MSLRTVGVVVALLLVVFAGGWFLGASGRNAVELQLADSDMRADVAEVRAAVLDARLSLTISNFGDARRSVQRAINLGDRIQRRLRETGQSERAGQVDAVLGHLRDADRQAGALDVSAAESAAQALRALEASVPVPPAS